MRDDRLNFNISVWIPNIDINGEVKRVICKDHNNRIVMIREYSSNLKIIEFKNEFNLPFIASGNEIIRYEVEYNKNGYVTNELYYRDLWNTPIANKDGFYGKIYEVDNNGAVTAEYGINSDGDIEENRYGIFKLQLSYDSKYNIIKEEFLDYNNNLIYIGNNYGYSYIEKEYDKNGNLIKKSFFNENKQSILSNYFGSVSIVYNPDSKGNITNIISYDENGKLFLIPYIIDNFITYCIHTMKYDNNGNIIEGSFYDVNTNKYITGEIYHKYRRKYDDNDNLIEESYYDKDDNLIICDSNYSIYKRKYDENYNLIEESYYDANGNPTIQEEHYHLAEYKYNKYNQITNKKYYGPSNKLVLGFYGFNSKFADTRIKYDRIGNIIEERYYDDFNNLILNSKNYAVRKINYNDKGLKIDESFYGTNEEPILITDTYDFFNTNKYQSGMQKIKYEYSNSILIKESYYGINGEPINAYHNLGTVKYDYLNYTDVTNFIKYNTISNLSITKTSYYDKYLNPIILDEMNYNTKYEGSNYNNEVYIFCDTNNKLTINFQKKHI